MCHKHLNGLCQKLDVKVFNKKKILEHTFAFMTTIKLSLHYSRMEGRLTNSTITYIHFLLESWTANPSRAPRFTPCILVGVCAANLLVFCVVLFVLFVLHFASCAQCCLCLWNAQCCLCLWNAQCCLCLWNAQSLLPFWFSLTFI